METADPTPGTPNPLERRRFMALVIGGLLAAPLAAEAQPAGKVYRVGWLASFSEPRPTFLEAMRELGYVEGKNVALMVAKCENAMY